MAFLSVERAVIRSLMSHIGSGTTLRVLVRVVWGQVSYHPFRALGKPADASEKLARAHVRTCARASFSLASAGFPNALKG